MQDKFLIVSQILKKVSQRILLFQHHLILGFVTRQISIISNFYEEIEY